MKLSIWLKKNYDSDKEKKRKKQSAKNHLK